jgi:hypothetical protein
VGLHETKKFLHNKTNGHQNEEAAHRIGEISLPAVPLTRVKNQNTQGTQKTKLPKNQ